MTKKATTFMKEEGKGYVEIKRGKIVWFTARMMVMDGFQDFNLPPGKYVYDKSDGMVKPHSDGSFPDWRAVIPKRKGYHKAEVETEYNMLKVLMREYKRSPVVILKAKGVRVFLNYGYYDYLTSQGYGEALWKVKDKESPVLFFQGKQLSALVMPVRIEE